ncbi:hypothetical protein G7Y89_g9885 [Cudoniella acicularis]|uniref:Uncharacterized protein n=1 Tax=Cudoniella acicularis TaxID=354080 RepID=A0A8H4RG15_9HELO|nr:hypothetical protein G7Y89_g9885 [Cudoniella acicularis]
MEATNLPGFENKLETVSSSILADRENTKREVVLTQKVMRESETTLKAISSSTTDIQTSLASVVSKIDDLSTDFSSINATALVGSCKAGDLALDVPGSRSTISDLQSEISEIKQGTKTTVSRVEAAICEVKSYIETLKEPVSSIDSTTQSDSVDIRESKMLTNINTKVAESSGELLAMKGSIEKPQTKVENVDTSTMSTLEGDKRWSTAVGTSIATILTNTTE